MIATAEGIRARGRLTDSRVNALVTLQADRHDVYCVTADRFTAYMG